MSNKISAIAAAAALTLTIMSPALTASAADIEYVTLLGEDPDRLSEVCGKAELIREYELFGGCAVKVPEYSLIAASRAGYREAAEFKAAGLTSESAPAEYEPETDNCSFSGEGMCIAVVGTGFLTSHESFFLTSEGRLKKEFVDSAELNAVCSESLYVSEKIPFAYNYADKSPDVSRLEQHGTAVISAAAGNSASPDHAPGAAPEAQILAMKVFSDDTLTAGEADVIAAIEDAVTLGADVIYLAFGEPCGFYDASSGGLSLGSAIDAAKAAGVVVTAAAGDSRQIGYVSPYYSEAAILAPTTDRPDTGTISYPGSADAYAVGCAVTNIRSADCLLLGDEKLPYGDTNHLWPLPTGGVSFRSYFGGQTFDYEFVPGLGRESDFDGIDLAGKLAIIERGELTFNEKCRNAALHGAVGVIIVDTQPDPDTALDVRMDISESPIPAIIISSASASLLREAETKKVTVSATERYYSEYRPTPTPSSESASGATPELLLKPDISVVGDSIECASPDGGYSTVGGSSISAARAAGMLVCVMQKLRADGYTKYESAERAEDLLASSAMIMTGLDRTPLSPRKQGSGAASLERALSAELLITSDGGHRIELGQTDRNWFSFGVTVENLTDSEKLCSLDAIVGSDSYDSFVYSELDTESEKPLSAMLGKLPSDSVSFIGPFSPFTAARVFPGDECMNLNSASENGAPYEFTLGAGESRTFRLTVLLDSKTLGEYRKAFPNGFFAEGYIRVCETSDESGDTTASIPFLAFIGDWSRAGVFDAELYSGITRLADSIYLYREYGGETEVGDSRIVLGANPLARSGADLPSKELICFSPTEDIPTAKVYLNLGLLRNVTDTKVRVLDSDGNIVHEYERGKVSRTYLDYTTNMVVSEQLEVWNGRADDNYYYIYPDGLYTVEITCKAPGGERISRLSYPLVIDTEPPELVSYEFVERDGNIFLKIEAADSFAVAGVNVSDENSIGASLDDGLYDITNLGRYIYIELTDYALNTMVVRVENPLRG